MEEQQQQAEREAFRRWFYEESQHRTMGYQDALDGWEAGRAHLLTALAQQPPAQAAGLTDEVTREQIEAWASLAGIVGSGANGALTESNLVRLGDFAIAAREALLSRAAPSGEPVAYVECRECGRCGHTGINDAHSQDECCSNCDWTGPAPKEDVCPGCAQTGTMRAACPKCGSVYRLLCETTVGAAPQPSAQQAETMIHYGGGLAGNVSFEEPAEEARGVDEVAHQDARFAIDGAIAFGRMGIKEPPQGHWLTEYWQIGKQLAEQPSEEARGVDRAHVLGRLEDMIADPMWSNHVEVSKRFLMDIRTLLAAPAAGTGQDAREQVECLDVENHRLRRTIQKMMARLTDLLDEDRFAEMEGLAASGGVEPPQAATGAQGLIALLREARDAVEQRWEESNTAADHDLLQRIDAALAASKEGE
ncbi:hypothetical protein J5T34_03915 [Cupriavidus gilardii]|uniref:hypothetical protein n=1 Tax=Cupriavidus gilardii TaxID=82541 RepID=UPI001ABE721D|nr:hypothetical protein [Cupriavidus gilardii]MBO4119886.1 hypothetical protein [Cupriavidus gilardii]